MEAVIWPQKLLSSDSFSAACMHKRTSASKKRKVHRCDCFQKVASVTQSPNTHDALAFHITAYVMPCSVSTGRYHRASVRLEYLQSTAHGGDCYAECEVQGMRGFIESITTTVSSKKRAGPENEHVLLLSSMAQNRERQRKKDP